MSGSTAFDAIYEYIDKHDGLNEHAPIHYLDEKETSLKANPWITKHIESLKMERGRFYKAKTTTLI